MEASLLTQLRLVIFAGLAAVAVWLWLRRRDERPRRYLAASFVSIGLALVLSWLTTWHAHALSDVLERLTPMLLLAFPWLLAALAWSFDGSLPAWLRAAGAPVTVLGLWGAVTPPGQAGTRSGPQVAFVVAFVTVWTLLSIAATVRLARGGDSSPTVRSRMRLLAAAAGLLTIAMLAAALPVGGDGLSGLAIRFVLPTLSAALFLTGFAPPTPLRMWWHHRGMMDFKDTQLALASATTADDIAASATTHLAELLGGGVALVTDDGQALAAAGIPREEAVDVVRRRRTDGRPGEHVEVIRVDTLSLVVRRSPYAPLFGQEEQALLDQFVGHLRLALERVRLFDAHREAHDAAEQARRELEATVYGLAHDLKNPTIALIGFVELLAEVDDPSERDELLGHLTRSATYVHDLVDALLELSRVGRTLMEVQQVDLDPVAHRVAERIRAANPHAHIEIEPSLPVVELNPVRAEQLLENLVSNAVRHGGREDLTVRLAGRRHDGDVTIVVADDGRGIAPEDRERIFDLFQRGPTTPAGGTGIGLTMVRRIAESYDGSVDVADTGPGATFEITLPESPASAR